MSTRSISARDRRALRFAALVALPYLGWQLVVAPFARASSDASARAESSRGLLARELAVVDAERDLPAWRAESRAALAAAAPQLVAGATPGARSAALIAWLQSRARTTDVRITEASPLEDSTATAGLAAISVRVAGRGALEDVMLFLRALENGTKLVGIRQIGLHRREEGDLDFDLAVTGYAAATAEERAQ